MLFATSEKEEKTTLSLLSQDELELILENVIFGKDVVRVGPGSKHKKTKLLLASVSKEFRECVQTRFLPHKQECVGDKIDFLANGVQNGDTDTTVLWTREDRAEIISLFFRTPSPSFLLAVGAQSLLGNRHPHILPVSRIICTKNIVCVEHLRIPGSAILADLYTKHDSTPLSQHIVSRFLIQISSALSECHRCNFVHGSISLETVVISGDGDISFSLYDFGYAYPKSSIMTLYTPQRDLANLARCAICLLIGRGSIQSDDVGHIEAAMTKDEMRERLLEKRKRAFDACDENDPLRGLVDIDVFFTNLLFDMLEMYALRSPLATEVEGRLVRTPPHYDLRCISLTDPILPNTAVVHVPGSAKCASPNSPNSPFARHPNLVVPSTTAQVKTTWQYATHILYECMCELRISAYLTIFHVAAKVMATFLNTVDRLDETMLPLMTLISHPHESSMSLKKRQSQALIHHLVFASVHVASRASGVDIGQAFVARSLRHFSAPPIKPEVVSLLVRVIVNSCILDPSPPAFFSELLKATPSQPLVNLRGLAVKVSTLAAIFDASDGGGFVTGEKSAMVSKEFKTLMAKLGNERFSAPLIKTALTRARESNVFKISFAHHFPPLTRQEIEEQYGVKIHSLKWGRRSSINGLDYVLTQIL